MKVFCLSLRSSPTKRSRSSPTTARRCTQPLILMRRWNLSWRSWKPRSSAVSILTLRRLPKIQFRFSGFYLASQCFHVVQRIIHIHRLKNGNVLGGSKEGIQGGNMTDEPKKLTHKEL